MMCPQEKAARAGGFRVADDTQLPPHLIRRLAEVEEALIAAHEHHGLPLWEARELAAALRRRWVQAWGG